MRNGSGDGSGDGSGSFKHNRKCLLNRGIYICHLQFFHYICCMIIVDNVIVSDEFINARFCCHLARCKGECCVAGDAGAPLEPDEVGLIEEYIEEIKPYMRPEGIEVIEKNDVYDYDDRGMLVTPLVNDHRGKGRSQWQNIHLIRWRGRAKARGGYSSPA